jgi:glycosyltransferase involved in cell wall biosynthesis
MKVLVVTNMFPTAEDPSFGCFVESQMESLQKKGISFDLVFVNGRRSKLNYLRGAWQVFWKSLHTRYDLVHAHYGLSGVLARCQIRSPVVITFCGSDVMDRLQGRISRLISHLSDLSIVQSRPLGQALGLNTYRIINNGLDLSLFQPRDHLQSRNELGFSHTTHYILFASDPARQEKRFDLAHRAYQIVCRLMDAPVELIVLYGQSQKKVPVYMNACDVLLLTSDWEGSPNVVKEAMACNMPIVSVDVADVRQMIAGTRNCHICPRDPSILAEKIVTVLKKDQRTDGREKVLYLSLERTADRIISLYQELTSKRKVNLPQ